MPEVHSKTGGKKPGTILFRAMDNGGFDAYISTGNGWVLVDQYGFQGYATPPASDSPRAKDIVEVDVPELTNYLAEVDKVLSKLLVRELVKELFGDEDIFADKV